ncbi:DegT/DnrJ/EryC1/StrS family aminotransferase [Haladaptatus sp. F3-133]|uniref:DegT/DnrJ/EryC1/StrS family aminotransferase n=1 Tax=Halorutilus salinus TaxID=2487751 RepID=A0A9Q4GFY8_9EURY|nr:DegT/DnrJ/EryC1/StrS family aminotransferase [Halorutilus salinus]MCX2818629.1 DegT/DnrJ/EryC1/StrS family aminotransferase [Halorutilus salinus]
MAHQSLFWVMNGLGDSASLIYLDKRLSYRTMTYEYDLFQSYSDEQIIDSVLKVLERESWWVKGPEIENLEQQVADVTDREHVIAVNSGTSALYATLESLGIRNEEIILPSFTYQATPNAVVAAGGQPVFADIEQDSFTLSVEDVESKITEETAGIIPVHFAGRVAAEIRELRDLAEEHGLFLLEDAAHSLGATCSGEPAGSFGDAATFSFAFNKIITTGQGGVVVTDNEHIAEKVRQFRVHGRNSQREYVDWGLNLAMSSIHAAIGVAQMSKLNEFIERRRELSGLYDNMLTEVNEIEIPTVPPNQKSVHFLYNICLPDRKKRQELRSHLDEHGIPTEVYYEGSHLTNYYSEEWGYERGDLPVTEKIADKILTLPFHVNLDNKDIENISEEIVSFF